jgi:hypothetical protein
MWKALQEKYGGAREDVENMAHARCVLNMQGYAGAQTCTRPCARTPTHTHTEKCATLIAFLR